MMGEERSPPQNAARHGRNRRRSADVLPRAERSFHDGGVSVAALPTRAQAHRCAPTPWGSMQRDFLRHNRSGPAKLVLRMADEMEGASHFCGRTQYIEEPATRCCVRCSPWWRATSL